LANWTVLVVDDDANMRAITARLFENDGAAVFTAATGKEALRKFYQHKPDLVILDVVMPGLTPDGNGWSICQEIRRLSEVPVIMLTALHQDEDIIHSLEAGADDFVTKPYSSEVLLARARAVLRRSQGYVLETRQAGYQDSYLKIDLDEQKIYVLGEPVKLTPKEYKLLEYLLAHANQVISVNQILEHVWGWAYKDNPDYIHVYISHLRQKLEQDPRQPKYFLSEHGAGYCFLTKSA
jgi:two-component system, OmpR family, KDP operon response regulator KdpE